METINSILKQMSNFSKPQQKFLIVLLTQRMLLLGRVNFRNLNRYSDLHEKAYSRQFRKPFDFVEFKRLGVSATIPRSHTQIGAIDCRFIFTIDVASEGAYWVYGTGSINSDGHITGNYTTPDTSEFMISDGQASLSSSDELTGAFTIDGVATETIQSGFMDQNKSIIVFVGTSDNDQMDLGIGFRTSDIPAEPKSSGGGGGGGCFINSIWDSFQHPRQLE